MACAPEIVGGEPETDEPLRYVDPVGPAEGFDQPAGIAAAATQIPGS